MRIAHVLTLIGAAAVSFTAAAAPAASTADTAMSQVSVSASSLHKVTEGDLIGMQGSYLLADGRTLRIAGSGNRVYADLGDTRTEILSVGPNKFASRNDSLRVTFGPGDNPVDVVVSVPAAK